MMKVIFLTLLLSGCGWGREINAHMTGYDRVCVNGISYLQFPSGSTTEVTADGKPAVCK